MGKSKISLVPIGAGVLVTMASMYMLMSLVGTLDLWNFQFRGAPSGNPQFWLGASIAWIVSVFIGCFYTAMASHSLSLQEGVLNSIATWAGSYLFFGGIALSIADASMRESLGMPGLGLAWHGFVSDLIAFLGALLGGILAVQLERGIFHVHKVHKVNKGGALPFPEESLP